MGFETARALLARGHQVVITARSETKALAAISKLAGSNSSLPVNWIELDLAKQESVDSFAERFAGRFHRWDVLINNAGAKVLPDFQFTESGIEYHYGVNAVGHFAITMDLLRLRKPNSRVVSVSSIVARFASANLYPAESAQEFSPGTAYALSKLSNLLFAIELNRHFPDGDLVSVAAHPGFAKAEPYGPKATRFFETLLAQSAASGAKPIVAASENSQAGSYLGPKYLELWGSPKVAKLPKLVTEENLKLNWEILKNLSGRDLVL